MRVGVGYHGKRETRWPVACFRRTGPWITPAEAESDRMMAAAQEAVWLGARTMGTVSIKHRIGEAG